MAEFAANGRYHFTMAEMRAALGVSEAAARLALGRLARKRLIASPARGFYVILPPEYKRLGCLPADQFIPALMAHLEWPYYAALLSAAQYHGARAPSPADLSGWRWPGAAGRLPVVPSMCPSSFASASPTYPVQIFNTPRGTIRVSRAVEGDSGRRGWL